MNSIKSVEVWWDDRMVGRLALTHEGLCAFEYSVEQLASGVSVSPFELPLRSGVFIAKPLPFDGGFGVFDDCLPDGWGLLVLDRYLQKAVRSTTAPASRSSSIAAAPREVHVRRFLPDTTAKSGLSNFRQRATIKISARRNTAIRNSRRSAA